MYFHSSRTPKTIPKLDIPESLDHYHNKENCFFNSPPVLPSVLNFLETSVSFVVSDASCNELDNAILISDETPPGSVLQILHEVSTSSVSPIGGNTTALKVSVLEEESFPEPTPQPVQLPPSHFDYKDSPLWSPGIGILTAEASDVTHRTRGSLANLFSLTSPPAAVQEDPRQIFRTLQHQRSASVPLPALLHRQEPPSPAPRLTARSFLARAPQRVTARPKPLSTDELILLAGIQARKKLHARVEKGLKVAAKFKNEASQRSTPQTQQSRMLTLPRGPNLRTAQRAEIRRNRTIIAN